MTVMLSLNMITTYAACLNSTDQIVDLSTSSFLTPTTDIEISIDDKSFQTTFDSISVGVHVDTLSNNNTNLTDIYMRQQQRLVNDLNIKVKNLISEKQHLKQQTLCVSVKKNYLTSYENTRFSTGQAMFLLSQHYSNI